MKVLFTNIQLDHRTGTEIVTRDLSRAMQSRGHDVAVYTPHPGPIAEELIAAGIPVLETVEAVPFDPDVVHGHHHSPTVDALERFPATPAIWVCHDRFQYQDIPPRLPNVRQYVAVDLNCRERLVDEAALPQDRVHLIHNSVDMDRFIPRCGAARLPARAAVFSNAARPGGYLDAIAEACRRLEIPLDVIGEAGRSSSDAPETLIGNYDIVFAKARCALEALAAGCAVVLIDHIGVGPMVTPTNVALLRDWNFGSRCLQGVPTADRLVAEMLRFNADDAAEVAAWIRKVADLGIAADQFERLYERAVEEGPCELPGGAPSALERSLAYAAQVEQRLRLLQVPIATMPLPPTVSPDVRLRMCEERSRVEPGAEYSIEVSISNDSAETLASVPPFPVNVSYHWVSLSDRSHVQEGVRTALTRPLHPGASTQLRLKVVAPVSPGPYVLRVTLVQESVFWFDDLTPPVACWLPVEVGDTNRGPLPQRAAMSLSTLELAGLPCKVRVVRDGTFADLGFADDDLERMLVFAGSAAYVKRAVVNEAVACILTTDELGDLVPEDLALLVSSDPKEAFFHVHNWLAACTNFYSHDRTTTVSQSAKVHPTALVDPRGVTIRDDCVIGPNVVINGPATVGSRTTIEAGAVIGSTAFQTSSRTGHYVELRHAGGVVIGEDCHIYANASIARGVFRASTQIGDRCQIGNGAFVSHQCRLGDNVFVGHNATVNGRVTIGDGAWVGPGSVVSNELTIGAGAHIALGSTVVRDIDDNGKVSGLPALDQSTMFRHAAKIGSRQR